MTMHPGIIRKIIFFIKNERGHHAWDPVVVFLSDSFLYLRCKIYLKIYVIDDQVVTQVFEKTPRPKTYFVF